MAYDDDDLELPAFLDRKLNPRDPDAVPRLNWHARPRDPYAGIIWPAKRIERAMREKAKAERAARKAKKKAEANKPWNG
jgi:hypothetical protein